MLFNITYYKRTIYPKITTFREQKQCMAESTITGMLDRKVTNGVNNVEIRNVDTTEAIFG